MNRLVAVSNRCGPVRAAAQAGGLAVALLDALRNHQGLWFGWSGQTTESAESANDPLHVQNHGRLSLATLDLPNTEFQRYYEYANRCLWPLFHFRLDLVNHDETEFQAYLDINRLMARRLMDCLQPDDLVWVHDYHLFTLGEALRQAGCRQRMGFFLHIPFPPLDILQTLPHYQRLMRGLFEYDLVGFQTEQDLERFLDYVRRDAMGVVDGRYCSAFGRNLQTDVFPAGIDAEQFQHLAFMPQGEREYRRMRSALGSCAQIIGVDRLDYTKGLLRRLHAFERLLDLQPDLHGKVRYLQIAPISRGELNSYRSHRRELEQQAVSINARFGRVDWMPVHYLNRPMPRSALAGLYRASRVGLIIPMRDGMNLVAKEYVAAQEADDPGVLVLSQFAGAAQQMQAALLVNPYDKEAVAKTCYRALGMDIDERRERHRELMSGVLADDASRWARRFVAALRGHPDGGDGDGFRGVRPVRPAPAWRSL